MSKPDDPITRAFIGEAMKVHSSLGIMVENTCAILVTALSEEITAADRAVLQTRLRWLNLDWGINIHFGKSTVDVRFVSRPRNNPPTDNHS